MKSVCITGGTIYHENGILSPGSLIIENGKIAALGALDKIQNHAEQTISIPQNYHVIPGMIDLHVHGAKGKDVMDASAASLEVIAKTLYEQGTTGFLATTLSMSINEINKALINIKDYQKKQIKNKFSQEARILGIHLEGPFLSPKKAGAQNKENLLLPDIALFQKWQALSDNQIKLITIAPELPNALALIKYCVSQGVIVSIGHTDADFETSLEAINAGATHATHLFNAMPTLHHRSPGAIAPLLLDERIYTELICDGVHLHSAIAKLILKLKTKNKIILITDAMRAQCCGEGIFDLGGQAVSVKGMEARLTDGTLAGSILTLPQALKFLMHATNCSLADALLSVSSNPAKQLGIFAKKGGIKIGKDADIVILDENLKRVQS